MYHRKRNTNRVGTGTVSDDAGREAYKIKPPEMMAQPKQGVQVHMHVHANVDVQVGIVCWSV